MSSRIPELDKNYDFAIPKITTLDNDSSKSAEVLRAFEIHFLVLRETSKTVRYREDWGEITIDLILLDFE